MKYYIVEMPSGQWNNIFIVKADNQKDAINKVFSNAFEWRNIELKEKNKECGYYANHIYSRSDLRATELEKRFKEDNTYVEEMICLN